MSKKFLDYNGLATLVNKLKDLFPLKSETASKNFVNNITGNLEDLDTEAKANLVAAINEAATSGGGGHSDLIIYDYGNKNNTGSYNTITANDQHNQEVITAILAIVNAGGDFPAVYVKNRVLTGVEANTPTYSYLATGYKDGNTIGLVYHTAVGFPNTYNNISYREYYAISLNFNLNSSGSIQSVSRYIFTMDAINKAYGADYLPISKWDVEQNYLSKSNTNSYTPTADYHPSTKLYTDTAISNAVAPLAIPEGTQRAFRVDMTGHRSDSTPLVLEGLPAGLYICTVSHAYWSTSTVYITGNENVTPISIETGKKGRLYLEIMEKIPETYDHDIYVYVTNEYFDSTGKKVEHLPYKYQSDGALHGQGSDYNHLIDDEHNISIYGIKTFTQLPQSSVTPTTDNQLVNKKYVDDSLPDLTNYYTKDEVDLYTIPILAVEGNMILNDGYSASYDSANTLASASKAINVLTAKCADGTATTGAILFKMFTQDSFIANAESFFTTQQTSYKFRGGYDKGSGELHVGLYITVTGSWTDDVFSASDVNVRKGYSYKLGDMVNKIDQSVYTFNNVSASWSLNNTSTNQSMSTAQKDYLQSRYDKGTLQNLSILATNAYGSCLLTYVASWNGSGTTSYVYKGVYENNMQSGSSTTYNVAILSINKSDSTGQLTGKYSFETRVDVLARKSDVYTKDQVYTKAEVDALIQSIANFDSTTGTLNILPEPEEESEEE